MPTRPPVAAVLFDLDGTLVDSAPDLAGAANELRQAEGLQALEYEALRPMVGSGARGMLDAAFGIGPGHARYEHLREQFLQRYEERILRETRVFAAMEPVLQSLERAALPWGIVTNKIARFSLPLVQGLGLTQRSAVLISGDSTPHAKPHPHRCSKRRGVLGSKQGAASIWAMTCATCRQGAPPAWPCWPQPGAIWAAARACMPGRPMRC